MSEELINKLNTINNIKGQIKTSIINKGGALDENAPFDSYPTAIDNISSGGEKIFTYYTGSNIVEGNKVMLTKANNPIIPNSDFLNGHRPYFINDGYAYCYDSQISSGGYIPSLKACQIVDGKIETDGSSIATALGYSGYNIPHISYTKGGKYCLWHVSTLKYFANSSESCHKLLYNGTAVKPVFIYYNRQYSLENFEILSESGNKYFEIVKPETNTLFWRLGSGYSDYYNTHRIKDTSIYFERKADAGKYIYGSFKNGMYDYSPYVVERISMETGVPETLDGKYINQSFSLSPHLIQTKDFKYIIANNGYAQLEYFNSVDAPNGDGIYVREYPETIKNAIGDRTIITVQTFYDNTFSLCLSDGATLMCNYNLDSYTTDQQTLIDENGGDLMQAVSVVEIEPVVIEGVDDIYYRMFSSDKLFWFVPLYGVSYYLQTSDNTAGIFEDNVTSDYLAFEPSKNRFNSTVLTGFMTGESKIENGRQMVEVSTVTG